MDTLKWESSFTFTAFVTAVKRKKLAQNNLELKKTEMTPLSDTFYISTIGSKLPQSQVKQQLKSSPISTQIHCCSVALYSVIVCVFF